MQNFTKYEEKIIQYWYIFQCSKYRFVKNIAYMKRKIKRNEAKAVSSTPLFDNYPCADFLFYNPKLKGVASRELRWVLPFIN